jgi:hypothetical protein
LAIRVGKVYLQTPPGVVRKPVEFFLDVEGICDEQFFCLIGILVGRGTNWLYYPSNSPSG